ncbi:MAG: glycoside hydrolase family 71/99 protein [Saccharofermentanales bacterium]
MKNNNEIRKVRNSGIIRKSIITSVFAIILLTEIFVSFPLERRAIVDATASNDSKTLIGCIRFDGYPSTTKDYWGINKNENSYLASSEWHWRLPFFAVETSSDTVSIMEDDQAIMDREIDYAKEANIDYWAFCYWPVRIKSGLEYALNRYQASTHKNGLNWCIIIPGYYQDHTSMTMIDEYVSNFKQSNYQKVLGNRPLIYVFPPEHPTDGQAFEALRKATIAAGLGSPYVVKMNYRNTSSLVSPDAICLYVDGVFDGKSYDEGVKTEKDRWDENRLAGLKVIPTVTSGLDARPRIEKGVSYLGLQWWEQSATPDQFADHLSDAIDWAGKYPATDEVNSILINSWNEFSENPQAICPHLIPGISGSVNRTMLDVVKSVTSGTYKQETNYIKNGTFVAAGKPSSIIPYWTNISSKGTETAAKTEFYNSNGSEGIFHLTQTSLSPFNIETYQYLKELDNGYYTISANIQSSGGQEKCLIKVAGYGGRDLVKKIPQLKSWTKININVKVTNNKCTISFISDSPARRWLKVDNVKMLKGTTDQNIGLETGSIINSSNSHSNPDSIVISNPNADKDSDPNSIPNSDLNSNSNNDTNSGHSSAFDSNPGSYFSSFSQASKNISSTYSNNSTSSLSGKDHITSSDDSRANSKPGSIIGLSIAGLLIFLGISGFITTRKFINSKKSR